MTLPLNIADGQDKQLIPKNVGLLFFAKDLKKLNLI